MVKINFGCGWEQKFPGWINVDLKVEAVPDVIANLGRDLPFASACADFIYTESFIEELPLAQGRNFLRECRRIIKPGGVMRLLTADLEKFARAYLQQPDWLVETWDITTAGLDAADRFLAEPQLPPALRRLVLEGRAGVERSLKARAFDAG